MNHKICLSKSAFFGIILAVLAIYTVLNDFSGFIDGFVDALNIK
jgi:hypothetical protein